MADNCIYRQCRGCNGTGLQRKIVSGTNENPVWDDVTCTQCNGDKILYFGELQGFDDLVATCESIFDKCEEIIEAIGEIGS